ncbi:OmpA family protein [Cellulophaga baltica]|uniref:Outer membrane protein OmpA n=1 Tax=Cellulophaga baltica TaxID=76594 RepID=A0A1G7F7G3_9FLAO|nr:OmpA family protein [Cellulophaga baltica]SDE71837.1 Outer membrane protein OmpA [Cellulophaga baltica]
MTKKTFYLLGIIITILLGTYFFMTCCSCCEETTEITETKVAEESLPEATAYPFKFSDGSFSYETNDNFNFNRSSSSILMPLSAKVTEGIDGIKSYLGENASKVFDITGFYTSDEANKSAFPNLGIARANAIKNHLVAQGIPSSSLNILGALKEDMISSSENVFLGPVSYAFSNEHEDLEDEMKALYDKIKADPLVLYFNTGEASINLTADERQKIADISKYLDKVAGANCSVVGHTDSQGNRITNIGLGQKRADFAKQYLSDNGIEASKIIATSKGPDSPIASNDTEEGRSQNRRTVITLN